MTIMYDTPFAYDRDLACRDRVFLYSLRDPRRCGEIGWPIGCAATSVSFRRARCGASGRVECMLKLVSPLGAARAAARLLNRRASLRRRPSQNARRPVGPAPGSAGLDWGAGRAARGRGRRGRPGPRAPDPRRTGLGSACRPSYRRRQAAGRADFSIDD
jgi:hypothetical protein